MFELFKNGRKLLGMNARNLEFIRPYNRSRARNLADNKILSKNVLQKAGIPVSQLIAKIRSVEELEAFDWNTLPSSFALKPNRGFGGEGILVVYGKKKCDDNIWIKADGSHVTVDDLKSHIRNIIDGSFSLANLPDVAFFEERLKLLKLFKPYSYKGIPDIRVIVFNKVPVMAMLRVPTKESSGKANLHQGAIGIGIDLMSGVTTTAIWKNSIIEYFPESRLLLSGIRIPYWKDILTLAVKVQEISGLGYLGADIAIDKEKGLVLLELNARPGLAIQLANLDGLRARLERIKGLTIKTAERGVRVGMDLFGGEVEEEVEDLTGRKVIGTVEKVKLISKDGKEIEVEAKIDTGAGLTSLDSDLAKQLGYTHVIDAWEKEVPAHSHLTQEEARELDTRLKKDLLLKIPDLADTAIIHSSHGTTYRPMIKIELSMHELIIPTKVSLINRSGLKYPIIIGKRNLGKFLIDVKKA